MKKQDQVFLTNHSKIRFKERTDYGVVDFSKVAKSAFKKGHEFAEFTQPMSNYLKSISFNAGKYVAKVYNNQVFIFNNCNGHRLLTVYAVPEEYLPIEQYLISKQDLKRCMIGLRNKMNGQQLYWSEFGLTDDITEAIEFTNQVKATNYLNNNYELDNYRDLYEIALF